MAENSTRVATEGGLVERNNSRLIQALQFEKDTVFPKSPITVDELYNKVEAEAKKLGSPGVRVKFHYFKFQSVILEYCWDVVLSSPDGSTFLELLRQDMEKANPEFAACVLERADNGFIRAKCLQPVLSKETDTEVPVFKNQFHLFRDQEHIRQSSCNGFKECVGNQKIFSPGVTRVFSKTRKAKEFDWVKPDLFTIHPTDEDPVKKLENKITKDKDKEFGDKQAEARSDLDKALAAVKEKLKGLQVFEQPQEPKFAFLVDNSGSIESVKDATIDSLEDLIDGLTDDQEFTIVFITDTLSYFNNGKTVPATTENLEAAHQFLESMRSSYSGGNEVFDVAMHQVIAMSGKVDAFYLFGDGVWPKDSMERDLEFARSGHTPLNVRLMGSGNVGFLKQLAQDSGGHYNGQAFDQNKLKKAKNEVAALRAKIKKEREAAAKKRKEIEAEKEAAVAKANEVMKRFRDHIRPINGACDPLPKTP